MEPARRHPARRGLDLDDDQRARRAPAAALRARRRASRASRRDALRGTIQNDILKEYIARGNYIFPPRPSMRLTTDLFAYCAERMPRWNTISICGYHIREAGSTAVQELAFTLANGIAYVRGGGRGGLAPDEFGAAALVLLQRAQRLLPGGREVPGGAAAVGADHARALRRDEPARADAALSRADRRLDADRAAAREQHRARRDPGAGRRSAAARSACTPTASTRRSRCRPSTRPRSRCARSRSSPRRRAPPTPPTRWAALLRRGADRRARGARGELIARDRRAGRRGRRGRGRASCRRRSSGPPSRTSSGRVRRARDRRRQRVRGGRGRARSSCSRSTRRPSGASSSAPPRCAPERNAEAAAAAIADVREAARGDANLLPPMREALARALHGRRDLRGAARRSGGRTTRYGDEYLVPGTEYSRAPKGV